MLSKGDNEEEEGEKKTTNWEPCRLYWSSAPYSVNITILMPMLLAKTKKNK